MAEDAAFLERICAEPEDDAPRLIYADWLDEQDDPRGEFIRLQIAQAQLPADDPRWQVLRDREAAFLARYERRWTESFRGLIGGFEFRRGFVETVNVEARIFLLRASELFQRAPIRHVRFLDVGSSLERLMDSPFLARLAGLTIYAQHIDERLTRALVDSPHLDQLQSLQIGRNRVGDRGAERLAFAARFRQLVHLDLSDNAIGDTGARAVASSSNLAQIQALQLRRNELSRAGLTALCATSTLTALRTLGLALNYVGAPQDPTRGHDGGAQIQELDLSENGLTPEGIHLICSLPGLARLARLQLARNEAGNRGAAVLSGWPAAACLRELGLAGNRIGDDGLRSLARSRYLFNLHQIDLADNPIHDPGAFELLNTTSLTRLRRVALPHLGLTPSMRRALRVRFPN